jgi:lipopolysaccharide biosynthesis glycosyltransferase
MIRVIVTGGTRDEVAPIAVFIKNIKDTCAHLFDEAVVYHDGIRKKDRELINSIFPTRFIEYKPDLVSRNDEITTYFTSMIFCKYECFRLLKEYQQVVWSDYDVVVQKSFDDFCKTEEGTMNILRSKKTVRDMFYKDIVNQDILGYDMTRMAVMTPLFAIDDSIKDADKIADFCYDKTGAWDRDLYLPEQAVLGLAVQEYGVGLKVFEFNDYACYPTKAKGDEYIIHAAGQPKFWNGMDNPDWNRRYKEWLALGGSPYSEFRKRLTRKVLLVISRIRGVRKKEHL